MLISRLALTRLALDRLLRSSAAAVAPSIARLINLSFSSGKFPSRWKIAKVTPLFKNGLECDPCNFRPISVLKVLSKIIECHFHDSLYDFLNEDNLIYSRQSGFRRKHSTETALLKIIDELLFNLDKDSVRHGSSGLSKGVRHGWSRTFVEKIKGVWRCQPGAQLVSLISMQQKTSGSCTRTGLGWGGVKT